MVRRRSSSIARCTDYLLDIASKTIALFVQCVIILALVIAVVAMAALWVIVFVVATTFNLSVLAVKSSTQIAQLAFLLSGTYFFLILSGGYLKLLELLSGIVY